MGFQFATPFTALVVGPFGASKVLSILLCAAVDLHGVRSSLD